MWFRVVGLFVLIGILMSWRSELSNVAARTALAAVAGGLFGWALGIAARSRSARERRDPS